MAYRYVREQIPGWATLQLYYDPSDLLDAWILLVNATTYLPQLSSSPTYTADVVAVGSQAMSNLGLQLYQEALGAMTLVNKTVFNSLGKGEACATWLLLLRVVVGFLWLGVNRASANKRVSKAMNEVKVKGGGSVVGAVEHA